MPNTASRELYYLALVPSGGNSQPVQTATDIYKQRDSQAAAARGGPAGRKFTITPPRELADAVELLADDSGVSRETVITQCLWQNSQIQNVLRRLKVVR